MTLELLRDGEPIEAWEIDRDWHEFRVRVPIARAPPERYQVGCSSAQPAPCAGWPRAGVLFRWRMQQDAPGEFEIRAISVRPPKQRE